MYKFAIYVNNLLSECLFQFLECVFFSQQHCQ